MSEQPVNAVADPLWETDGYVLQDRSGYTVDGYNLNTPGASPYFVVHRESDGTGIGAYGNDKAVDDAIALDRAWVAENTVAPASPDEIVVNANPGSAPATPDSTDGTINITNRRISR